MPKFGVFPTWRGLHGSMRSYPQLHIRPLYVKLEQTFIPYQGTIIQ